MIRRKYVPLGVAELILYGVVVPHPEALMDPVLRKADGLLADEVLVEQVVAALGQRFKHSVSRGRYGTPAEVVLRMLVLKHLRSWSYEQLEWEVRGNLVYRRFCRIDGGKVPDAKTLVRLGQLLEGSVRRGLFERLVDVAVEKKVSRGRKMRMDTTVVEAPIHYPTDSGLCEDAVRMVRRAMRRLVDVGVRLPFKVRDVKRSLGRRMREISQAVRLRGDAAEQAVKKPYAKLLRITGRMVRQGTRAAQAAQAQLRRLRGKMRAKAQRTLSFLKAVLPRAKQVVRQTRARIVLGNTRSADKLISLVEPYAQILRRGKLHRPTEFGMLVKVQEAEGGLITDVALVPDKADAPLLVPGVHRHREVFGHAPTMVATDRGFFSHQGEREIQHLGVEHAVIPKPGSRSQQRILHEQQRWFRRGRAWRTGGEARISLLKHCFGMARSRYHGQVGLLRTVLWAAIANNLVTTSRRLVPNRHSAPPRGGTPPQPRGRPNHFCTAM